ncbi:rho GTPase-activating protein 18 isoform X2 [Lissotriton helveticus]
MNWLSNSSEVVLTAYHPSSTHGKAGQDGKRDEQASPGRSGQPAMNHGSSPRSTRRPPLDRSGSQDSLDELSLDDYFTEIQNINETSNSSQEEKDDVVFKEPDEGELEEEWLKEAGLSNLFAECAGDSNESIVLLSTLTRTQSEAVRKRLDTLSQTMRKKNKPHQVPDVREIFNQDGHSKGNQSDENGLKSSNGSCNSTDPLKETRNDKTIISDVKENIGSFEDIPETAINLEVSFAEQAANLKDTSKGKKQGDKEDDTQLPNFRLQKDKTGNTKIGDLAAQDMKKVYSLALIELTALYDILGTELKQQKAVKIKAKDYGLFGVPLSVLLEQDQRKVPNTRVPLLFHKLISHIEELGLLTEGILRIPGVASRVKNICQELESKFHEGLFNWDSVKQHDAASILKLFIRELPQPLLTAEYLKCFNSVQNLPTRKQQLQALNLLMLLLPDANRDTLKALLEFLQRVVDRRQANKMTLKNVAMVMAPNLFSFHGSRLKANEQSELTMAAGTANVMLLMIKYQEILWTIPKFIVSQVRQQNIENQRKQSKEKAMKKLLKKMAYDREKHDKPDKNICEADVPQGVIRVQAPQFSKVSMAVQLTEDLKASDILSRFLSQESGISQNLKTDEICLYEIGGNIVERSLEVDTYMKDLFQLNPSAEWVIKPKPNT